MSCSSRTMKGQERLDNAIHNEIAVYKRVRSIARAELGYDISEKIILSIYKNIVDRQRCLL